MTLAFTYRARREHTPFRPAEVGATITFDERVEYVLCFPTACPPDLAERLRELGGDLIGANIGVLAFGNFVGRSDFAGVAIQVVSTKIGAGGVSRLLQEVSELASSLVFGWRAPTRFEAAATTEERSAVPYHQLQFLRHSMIAARPGERLQDWLATIERSPTRRFEPERPVVSPERVRRLDHRAMRSIFTRIERLVPVPATAAIAANGLAKSLTFGTPPRLHFPVGVAAPRGRLSFDTAENRFVKHVVGECLAIVYRFVDHPKLHASLRADCRNMLSILEQAAGAPFLGESGRLSGFNSPSQALAKADGYREIFGFWSALTSHVSLPRSAAETTRLLEGRDMATLYEYWVFLKVLEAACNVTGLRPASPPAIQHDELGESLTLGLSSGLGATIVVRFNPSYMRSTASAYSTPLRPDVIVEVDGKLHAFDAKYRLDHFDIAEGNADDGASTYQRADLYKMHTYRDAITRLNTAFVVYPGTEFVYFDRSGIKHGAPATLDVLDGVGAIPLRPTEPNPAVQLQAVLHAVLIQLPLAASAV